MKYAICTAAAALTAIVAAPSMGYGAMRSVPSNCVGCSFAGRDLRGADLRGANFARAELTGVNFQHARLNGARFDGARMASIDLRGALDGISDADVRSVLVNCVGCDLRGASLAGRDLHGIAAIGADASDIRGRGVRLIGADIEGINFNGGDLRDAALRGAKLCTRDGRERGRIDCASFRNADVRGADFRGSLICSGREPHDCTAVDAATLRAHAGSSLVGATLP